MRQLLTIRVLLPAILVALLPQVCRAQLPVQIVWPAQSVQPKSGCSGDTAAFCSLRVYQVMVESFIDGDPARNYNAGYGTSHHKGDLRGIINSLDYIKSLGMNAIWMTPVFDSHAGTAREGGGIDLKLDATGYYARDYFKIDPKFGSFADAKELVDKAHAKGLYVFFDGVFGHHKGNLIASPTGKLPVNSSPGFVDYSSQQSVEFYKEVATYWINELGIDGWRLDQSYQVPPNAWRQIRSAVEVAAANRAAAGHQWGTLGYMVAEDWSDAGTIANRTLGPNSNPILHSAFDFPVRYATVGVLAAEESGWSGRPASALADWWSYGAHGSTYASHALPNLMIGNHDLVRFGDLIQRAGLANPTDPEYWARHRLAFMVQAAYSGPITRYYGEEIGDELPNYANRVINNCASLGLCDDHVARTSAKVLDVSVTSGQLTADQHELLQFHRDLMAVRDEYAALSHGSRQHLYSDETVYVDLKTYGSQQILFAMNVGAQSAEVAISQALFSSVPANAWDILAQESVAFSGGFLPFALEPLMARYILIAEGPLIAGDLNADGTVDAADYVLWRKGEQPSSEQYETWCGHFGRSSGDGAASHSTDQLAAVPEPASLISGLIALAAWQLRRPKYLI